MDYSYRLLETATIAAVNATVSSSSNNLTTHHDEETTYHKVSGYIDDGHHGDVDASHGHHSEFGVHIEYEELYNAFIFLTCIYVGGKIASKALRMPDLVGEIIVGILLGPPLADFVPNPPAWVLLGEMGLVILVLEAGIDIDVSTLKLIGTRGFIIATVGSVLPIGLGMLIAWIIQAGDTKAIICAGATFGPTSLGIALNILRSGGVLNTPVGQLIISAAVIDDMIALIILSQLESLTGDIDAMGIVIPVLSALLFLFVGGYVAIWILPTILERNVLSRIDKSYHDKVELTIMFAILLALKPATFYSKASYLMGAFVAGLAFCTSHGLHAIFVRQFKRLLQWLMRIFFAASIGFQVPITEFGKGKILWQGAVFTLALLGKLAVGFMVPNFTQSRSFTNFHLRDCLITGFSMAAEGEFAFVIAVFSVDQGLIDKDLYASVVLAVLLSTIIPPFLLRGTISYYGKRAEQAIEEAARAEADRKHDLEHLDQEAQLLEDVKNMSALFLCIQTQSEARWNLLYSLMSALSKEGLHIIDHRAWHPRGVNTTLINEIYCKDTLQVEKGKTEDLLKDRIEHLKATLESVIDQPDTARVKVQRWYPGVVEEIVEEVDESKKVKRLSNVAHTRSTLSQRLISEAENALERKEILMAGATKRKSVADILGEINQEKGNAVEVKVSDDTGGGAAGGAAGGAGGGGGTSSSRRTKRRFQKTRSTPVVGGGLFGETDSNFGSGAGGSRGDSKDFPSNIQSAKDLFSLTSSGHGAEIIVKGESYKIRIDDNTLRNLRTGYSGEMLDSRGISVSSGMSIQREDVPVVNRLQGYVRNVGALGMISEDTDDCESEVSGSVPGHKPDSSVNC